MSDLVYLSATEALELFISKELSPVEFMTAVIKHAEEVEPRINAFSEKLFEQAIQQAQKAEKTYNDSISTPRPLEGLPIALKDEHSIAGMLASEGSLLAKDYIAEETHPIVERIMAAGGIVHARTTTPEYSCVGFTHSKLWGVTRNPWNLEYSPGGSSGGSAAALAAGTATLATGSDIGGSIRIPASFSGVVGYKPPYGRVPSLPPYNLDHYCHDGPLARSVADCILLENVISGPHPKDIVSLKPGMTLPQEYRDIKGMRIVLSITLGDFIVDPEVEENTRAVAEALRQAGAIVEEVELSWKKEDIFRAADIHFGSLFGSDVYDDIVDHQELAMPYTLEFARQTMAIAEKTTAMEGLAIEAEIYAELGLLLDDFDALLCPTNAINGLVAGEDYVDVFPEIRGTELRDYFEGLMTVPFNITGRCPVLSVPSGAASNGVPTGVQIVGPSYEEEKVFRIGSALERSMLWFSSETWRPDYRRKP